MIARSVREFGGIAVDTRDWPIILLEFPELRLDDGELQGTLDHIERLLREAEALGERSYQITDFTRMQQLAPANQRKHAAEWMQRTIGLQRAASIGGANVCPSTILRGLVTAVFWFQKPPTPTIFVATRKEAMVEAVKLLEAAKVPVPANVVAKVREAER